ncbi:MAG: hypothetical protein A3G18_04435 [Rhodospirillales bacterium RIFCSPLOWO2_12_FULL_58_28]|nr:MAG: hypothetical protein A3H92_09790 [Rhodospirillales bacterium RIFCSPLOWO2_02_FULL_58_16]OHC76893.1 MAG: hypothetical protein A3G18_04435 [Rhodospirillales bacterium RIFCSPLOWO2_12_FULL_58_28]
MRQPRKHPAHSALNYRPPTYLRNIRIGLKFLVIMAAASIVYALFWAGMAYQFREAVNGWMEMRRAEGYQVKYESFRLSGFPLIIRMEMKEIAFAAKGDAPSWSWRGDKAVVEASPWNPWRMAVSMPGGYRLDIAQKNGPAAYAGVVEEFTVRFPTGGGWPPQGELTVRNLSLSDAGSGRAAASRVVMKIERTGTGNADYRTPTIIFRFEAEGVNAPGILSLPLGGNISLLAVEGSVLGAIPPGPWPEALGVWRDAGGTLEVKRLDAALGPLTLKAGGAMALDAMAQPIGAFTAKVQGFFETVEELRKDGIIGGKDAVTATAVLGAMARKSKDGAPTTLNLSLTIQDRRIYAGPVAFAELPAIPWE